MCEERTNPLDIFKGWFRAQNQEIQTNLSFLAAGCIPEYRERNALTADPERPFNAWLDREADARLTMGKVLCLRGLVSVVVFRKKSTPEDWERIREGLEEMLRAAEQEGPPGADIPARQALENLPRRSRVWMDALANWQRLLRGGLSDERIAAWFEEACAREMRPRLGEG